MGNAQAFTKSLRIGTIPTYNGGSMSVYVTVKWDGKRLSITGVEGPRPSGDCTGSAGQITLEPEAFTEFAKGWDGAKVAELAKVWDRWHLNDMRAGCEHQRQIDTTRKVEVVEYRLTTEASQMRTKVRDRAADAALNGEPFNPTPTERALGEMADWFKARYEPPEADSHLSGCFEVRKRETKAIGWVYPHEHPDGMLTRPCPECGYKYGSAWLHEDVPPEVLEWLQGLPDADRPNPWRD